MKLGYLLIGIGIYALVIYAFYRKSKYTSQIDPTPISAEGRHKIKESIYNPKEFRRHR